MKKSIQQELLELVKDLREDVNQIKTKINKRLKVAEHQTLLSSGDVCKLLDIKHVTFLNYLRDGVIKPDMMTEGGHYRFKKETVETFAQSSVIQARKKARNELLSLYEASIILRISRDNIKRLIEEKKLIPAKLTKNGFFRFYRDEIDRYLKTTEINVVDKEKTKEAE